MISSAFLVMFKDFEPRLYQETILHTCVEKNTLVVLPTGMGKTAVAMMLAFQRLKQFPNSKIIFLAPTKPLAEQHLKSFEKHFEDATSVLFTGAVPPKKRETLWKDAQLVFSTPQGLVNDVVSNRIDLKTVSLVVFDEAHRAVGDYDYVFLAKQFNKKANFPKILALTASPGSDLEKVEEVCKNLFIESIEIRTDSDPDVKPYIQDIDMKFVKVDLPAEFLQIKQFLENCIKSKLREIQNFGFIKKGIMINKREFLALQSRLHGMMASGDRDFSVLKSVSLMAEVMKTQHALELLESQGITQLYAYLNKLVKEAKSSKTKAIKNLVADLHFKSVFVKAEKLYTNRVEHPKLDALKELIQKEVDEKGSDKIILFTQFRDTAVRIKKELEQIPGVLPAVFVGQAKKSGTGLSQKKQIETIQKFRDGFFNILIATSVAEEGLDIPRVDLVVFYEPIPSAIRQIQRRGRTGRQEKGRVIVLMAKNTRDEGYRWSAHHKEKRMYRVLETLKNSLDKKLEKQPRTLNNFIDCRQEIKIFADFREKGNHVVKELCENNVTINLEVLDSADYILSSRVGVELKTVSDFVGSIVDGRLLSQLRVLKQKFERPMIIIEGEENLFTVRNVHPNAIRGMLATIAVSYGIPIIQTKDSRDTAALLVSIAKREQEKCDKDFSPHSDKKPVTLAEQQEYIVSSLPNVGPAAAKELLKHFKSIKNIVNASEEDLKKVSNIGPKIAKALKDVF
ncbi:DEAD/DEAH box helicase, partial [Candidatus Woesearchaeota archaeon]|nr:DEAD/DEAH box helicase [Candidatus Woesearchaeota archaeon]